MAPRSSRYAHFCSLFALGVLPLILMPLQADAQTKGARKKDPCDPTYVPAKNEPPPVCPGVKEVPLEPSKGPASLAPTPPPVEKKPPQRTTPTKTAIPKAVANTPGFRMMSDGSSKIFLQIHGNPKVQQVVTRKGVTFVLTDCRVPVNNNRRPLMTQYFNTPVADVRLRPFRSDVHLEVDLRAEVAPTPRLIELVPGKVVLLEVVFPPGDYQRFIPGDPYRRYGRGSQSSPAPPPPPPGRGHPQRGTGGPSQGGVGALGPPTP